MTTKLYLKKFLQTHKAHPIVLYKLLLNYFGEEFITWQPNSTKLILNTEFDIQTNSFNLDKINAIKTAMYSRAPFLDFYAFEKTINAFTNTIVNFGNVQGSHFYQVLVGTDCLFGITEIDPKEPIFTEDVSNYVATTAMYDNIVYVEDPWGGLINNKLLKINKIDKDFQIKVKQRWDTLKTLKKDTINFNEDPVDTKVQTLYIAYEVRQHYKNVMEQQLNEIHHAIPSTYKTNYSVQELLYV